MQSLVMPQINLNGSSRGSLVEQQCEVLEHLREVYRAMGEASPNGRDYQFRPAEFRPAQEAWQERVKMIHSLMQEIESHAMAIQDGE